MYERFEYSPQSTRVDSPIDDALESAARRVPGLRAHHDRAGAPARQCRAATSAAICSSQEDSADRSADGATHAWVEALLPDLGWVGFDPTNNLLAGERHIRVAIGRDYADVPPTRGVSRA